MKISLNWIKRYIDGLEKYDIEELTRKMVDVGLDIESVEFEGEKFNKFVVAEVTEKRKHPNADKLSLCKVNTGSEEYSVVCGAPNVEAGQKVCFAKIGAIIPRGNFEIKKSKIRGELSEGMICAEDEIGLSEDHTGIMVLAADSKPGQDFADFIGANDYLIEIGITPNRGDLLSHFGIAREIALATGLEFRKPDITFEETDEITSDLIKIQISEPDICKRFTGRVFKNIEVKESPDWLKKFLLAVGLRPVNNIVDITNFVMYETGQPLHAFDYDKISGKEIIIRNAKEGDKFVTLDGKERKLNEKSLMVCDSRGYSGIAGIMGGIESEIVKETKNIFLECAYFDPVAVRKNSKKLGLQTDASQRFERGVDIENVEYSSLRASMLICEICGAKASRNIADEYPNKFEKLYSELRFERAEKILGKKLEENTVIEKLTKIGFKKIESSDRIVKFEIPEYRRLDVFREIDLIEETARVLGYDYFEDKYSFEFDISSSVKFRDKYCRFVNTVSECLIGNGFNEIITYSQQDENKIRKFNENFVRILNPNSVEMNVMRINLRYGLLNTFKTNYNYSGKDYPQKLFETGNVFSLENGKFQEKELIALGLCGNSDFYSINTKERKYDILDLKGEVEKLFTKLNLESYELFYYYGREKDFKVVDIKVKDDVIGSIYEFDEQLEDFVEKDVICYICEIDSSKFFKYSSKQTKYKEVSKYPIVKRDLAFIADTEIKFSEIMDLIKSAKTNNLIDIKLFDIYEDKKLGDKKKSLAFTLNFGSDEKTLTDEEVNKDILKIVKKLERELKILLRDK